MTQSVAITGAEGFIGSHLVEALVVRGDRVRALAQYNSISSWGWLDTLDRAVLDAIEIVPGDVRDAECVDDLVRDADVVYHLAALVALPYSYRAPTSYVQTNVLGTLNVLAAARRHDVGRIVHTSASDVYAAAHAELVDETHPQHATSPYSASKISADKIAESFFLSFDTPVVTIRPFDTYGPRESARGLIPAVITQISTGRTTIRLESLDRIHDFTFVTDIAAALIAGGVAPAADVVGETLNAGSGAVVSVTDLVLKIGEVMGTEVLLEVNAPRTRPAICATSGPMADITKIMTRTSWRPQVDLASGLAATVDWFTRPTNLVRYKMDFYTV